MREPVPKLLPHSYNGRGQGSYYPFYIPGLSTPRRYLLAIRYNSFSYREYITNTTVLANYLAVRL
jgi:hypothetical protein